MNKKIAQTIALMGFPTMLMAGISAQAATITTSTGFSYSTTTNPSPVKDTTSTNGPVSATSISAGSLTGVNALSKFDSSLGVLTGVEFDLTSNQTLAVDGSVKRSSGSGTAAISGTSSSAARVRTGASSLIDTGITDTTFNANGVEALSASASTTASATAKSLSASDTFASNSNQTIAGSKLNNFVGTGSISVGSGTSSAVRLTWSPSAMSAQLTGSSLTSSNATSTLSWSGTAGFTYTYLLHSLASFNSGSSASNELTLDFGNVVKGSSVSPLDFSLFNMSGDRTGLDFTGLSGTGGTATLTTNLPTGFSNLGAGDLLSYAAFFDTSAEGSFAATYTLYFRDTLGTGASASQQSGQTLTLNLLGNVVAPAAVPVPPAVWLFSSALAGLGIIGRRRSLS